MISKSNSVIRIKLIAAINKNRVIGKDNKMPWSIKNDLRHFREITLNHTVIMGRKTYESIGKPLDLRNNIVISGHLKDNRVTVYRSLDEAFEHIKDNEVFIIGGESIYNATIDIADEIYLTYIDALYDGDRFFPEIDMNSFVIDDIEHFKEDIHYAFIHLIRKKD